MKNKKKMAGRAGGFMLALLMALGLAANLSVSVFAYGETASAQYPTDSFEIEFIPIPDGEAEAVRKAGELNRDAVLSSQLPQRYESLYNTSNLYYYNQMNSSEKDLYNKIVKSCENLCNSYADITICSGKYYFADYIQLNSPMSQDTVRNVIFAVYYSNPQFFFLNNSYTGHMNSSGSMISVAPMIRDEFIKGTVRMEANAKIQNITNDWMAQIKGLRSDLDKEKWIARKLCETITYKASDYDQTIAGALINRECVCNGYAMAMTYFCNAAGLSCTLVTSHNHAWNVVSLGGVWYEVDATWMDQTGNWMYIDSRWLNKSRSTFEKNDSTGSHKLDSKHTGMLSIPNCTKDYPSCADHIWEESVVSQEPTDTAYGYKFHFCSVCSDGENTWICPDNYHSYGTAYVSDGKSHWRVCKVCENVSEKTKHSFKNDVCSVCNYVKPFGDLNDDGVLNNADIILLGRAYMAGTADKYAAKADMNKDGKITNADIILLGRLYMNQKV